MADFEHWQLEIWLEFVHGSFDRHNNFSEGYSECKKDAQVICECGGQQPHEFFNSTHFNHTRIKCGHSFDNFLGAAKGSSYIIWGVSHRISDQLKNAIRDI